MIKQESEVGQLSPGKTRRWVVIYKGAVQPKEIIAETFYRAREAACSTFLCERYDVQVGLLPDNLSVLDNGKATTRTCKLAKVNTKKPGPTKKKITSKKKTASKRSTRRRVQ